LSIRIFHKQQIQGHSDPERFYQIFDDFKSLWWQKDLPVMDDSLGWLI